MNSNAYSNSHLPLCTRCKEKPASMECCECDGKGLKLCYNCDINIHQFSFRNSHLRALIKSTSHPPLIGTANNSLTPRMQPIKAPEQIKGSITPRVRIQVDTKALKGSDNKENRVRNSSVGSVKRSNEAKPISIFTKNIELKKADEEASNAMIIKYQELINKKDQIIDSMGKTIESLNNQLTQAQDNVKSTQLQISNMRGAYNEDLTKMKFKVKKLEEKRGHSLTQRNANISADNKDNYKEKIESYINDKNSSEFTKLKEQLIAQTKNYKIKYDSLAKEKERQFDNIRVAKRLLEYEESNHKKTKDKLKNAQKELNALKQALGKRK